MGILPLNFATFLLQHVKFTSAIGNAKVYLTKIFYKNHTFYDIKNLNPSREI